MIHFPFYNIVEQLHEKNFLSYLVEGLGQVHKDSEYLLNLLKGIFDILGKLQQLIFCDVALPVR